MSDQDRKIKTLLEKSGIPTHLKAISFLKDSKWPIIVGPYYYDDFSKSAREIDIIAERVFENQDRLFDRNVAVAIQLFIECKYINQEIVFWFDKFNKGQAVARMEKETALRIAYNQPGGYDVSWNEFHYLKYERVAKLFSPNANNEDVFYKAINQSLLAQQFYSTSNRLILKRDDHFEYQNISRTIRYPIILCDNFDKLFEVRNDSGNFKHHKISSSFLLEIYYNGDYVLIDVVNIDELGIYLGTLETEIKSLVSAFQFKARTEQRNP